MATFSLIVLAALSLGALYFLVASGLALIYGLMHVLSFAHGSIVSLCAFIGWAVISATPGVGWLDFVVALAVATLMGAAMSVLLEIVLLKPLFGGHLEQLLVTVGVGFAMVAIMEGVWGPEEQLVRLPGWLLQVTELGAVRLPNSRIFITGIAVVVFFALIAFLRWSRHGLVIRAGVEDREMVQALGANVERSFTLVFGVGGALAGLCGALAMVFTRAVSPSMGDAFLIMAFMVLLVGGAGSITGVAIASLGLALVQSLGNFYVSNGLGDIMVVLLLALVLLIRPGGLVSRKGRLA